MRPALIKDLLDEFGLFMLIYNRILIRIVKGIKIDYENKREQ